MTHRLTDADRSSNQPALARISEDGRCQSLPDHLMGTAARAREFATAFGCGEWGYLIGLWHDLGKFQPDFQCRLLGKPIQVDHSIGGAVHAVSRFGNPGRILAYPIAGHHAGLADWQTESSGMAGLAQRLQRTELEKAVRLSDMPTEIVNTGLPSERLKLGSDKALWIRMLFSCLVDADFLDTEAFLQPEKAALRGGYPKVASLLGAFSGHMAQKLGAAQDTPVNQLRRRILERCILIAGHEPGVFTLTVPTGGGKTLSSMAFALHHARRYEKQRVIYVIPYTSIIEQVADEFRGVFGDAVVEHHSNFEEPDSDWETSPTRLASENWDAPIIVTTSVQFFESLFASRSSRCRKLHNVVNSVVVLDEAQLLPPEFLTPILAVVKELQRNYGVTFVLSTATQPALGPRKSFDFDFPGLPDTVEMMENPFELHGAFKRVEVKLPADLNTPTTWEQLASELERYPSVLCIVNRRDDCRQLFRLMPEGTIHLSALMCGAHRSEVIKEIRRRLKNDEPTRVISTQLVEAGVDVDFPVVYRALAGLDSIAQAAGRCNREGRLKMGHVVVFVPPSETPIGHLRQAAEIGRRLLAEGMADPLAPERFERFFRELFWLKGRDLDKEGILHDLDPKGALHISFRTAASKFHLIDDAAQVPVLVRYGDGTELVEILRRVGPERWLLRKLQRYVVNLPRYVHSRLLTAGSIREIHAGVYVQEHGALYDAVLGFCPDKSVVYEADELVV